MKHSASKYFLVIPTLNEQGRIETVVRQAVKYIRPQQIIVVDDGSHRKLKLKEPAVLLHHIVNLGKGAALKTGVEYAFAQGAEAVVMIDGDGQHDPNDLPRFIDYLDAGYDVVFGSRRPTLDAPLIRLLGNKFASIYINLMFGIYVADILSGYRALTATAYQHLAWSSARYGVETEIVARLGKHRDKLNFVELPIETVYIDKYKGVTILDALRILFDSLWWKLS